LKFADGQIDVGFNMASDVINQESVNEARAVNVIKGIHQTQLRPLVFLDLLSLS
jgi:hypothetical protein